MDFNFDESVHSLADEKSEDATKPKDQQNFSDTMILWLETGKINPETVIQILCSL